MKVIIIGAGRMGIRHLQGVLKADSIEEVTLLDIIPQALQNAQEAVNHHPLLSTCLVSDFKPKSADVCIIASTAKDRKPLIHLAVQCQCRYLLIEKPLGQSYEEIQALTQYLKELPLTVAVNMNMRLYKDVRCLKQELRDLAQSQGEKIITINTGTLGIGCNGIHYLDTVFFLLDADRAEIISAEIDDKLIPSGRGEIFCDFGGWAVIKFYKQAQYIGKLLISMASDSSVFGGWEIVAPYARFVLDEVLGTRRTILRKADSTMPIYRYAADFEEQATTSFSAPFLGDLTTEWINNLTQGINLLPDINESLKAHKLLFEWLSYSKTHADVFPIT